MMLRQRHTSTPRTRVLCAAWLALVASPQAGEAQPPVPADAVRIFVVGNSFLNWMPGVLREVESLAGIERHELAGSSFIGGSRVLDHWVVPDDGNTAKAALTASKVDVLVLAGRVAPDEGIEKFVALGLAHNPRLRVTLQANWLPFDRLDRFPDGVEAYGNQASTLRDWNDPPHRASDPHEFMQDTSLYDVPTAAQIARLHSAYFDAIEQYVANLNRTFGRRVLYVVPVGHAVVALRGMIAAGTVPEIPKQSGLFADRLGHPKAVIRALSAYCHFAVIYGRSPVGLPLLPSLKNEDYSRDLDNLLQRLAWDAVIRHPASGVAAPQ